MINKEEAKKVPIYTMEEFKKDYIGCETWKHKCGNCGKEWTYGEVSMACDADFFDGRNFALLTRLESEEGNEVDVHVCGCGVALRVYVHGNPQMEMFMKQLPL